jgi:multidrug efflux pump subunit AcrB
MPSGTRLEVSNDYIARVEKIIREEVKPKDLDMIVSNIGVYPDLSAIFTTNASMDTAFVQTSLKEGHSIGSYEYMRRVQELSREMPELTTYFQAGGLIDGVINQGLPAPIDVQVSLEQHGRRLPAGQRTGAKIRTFPNVSATYIPQDINYPGIQLNIDREKASLIGLSAKDMVDNVITAMTSDGMVAPSYWIDPASGNNYMVTVQYANHWIQNMSMQDFESIPLRGTHPAWVQSGRCGDERLQDPAESICGPGITARVYAAQLGSRYPPDQHSDGSRSLPDSARHRHLCCHQIRGARHHGREGPRPYRAHTPTDRNTRILLHGAVVSMNEAFENFGLGLLLAVVLVYLVLMAQFTSFIDPFIILMAIPPGIVGVVAAAAGYRRHAEHHVADGHHHDDRHRGFEQRS